VGRENRGRVTKGSRKACGQPFIMRRARVELSA